MGAAAVLSRLLGRRRSAPVHVPEGPWPEQAPRALVRPVDGFAPLAAASPRGAARLDAVLVAAAAGDRGAAKDGLLAALAAPSPELRVQDEARRAAHLALAARLLGADLAGDRLAAIAREIAELTARVEARLPAADPVARVEALTCTTAAALHWPAVPGARHAWARGLGALRTQAAQRVRADGTPADGDVAALAAWLEQVMLLDVVAREEGIELPTALGSAAASAAWYLHVRSFPTGGLPAGDVLPVLFAPAALIPAARNATLARGWAGGDAAPVPDGGALTAFFAGRAVEGAKPLGDADWLMWSFADGRVAVLHTENKGRHWRVVVDAGAARSPGVLPGPEIEIDGTAVIPRHACVFRPAAGLTPRPATPPTLAGARVDVSTGRSSRKAKVVLELPASSPEGGVRREITVRQARVIVEDEPRGGAGEYSLRWVFAPGIVPSADGNAWKLERPNGKPFKLELDARLQWRTSRDGDAWAVIGEGRWDAEDPLRLSIEWT